MLHITIIRRENKRIKKVFSSQNIRISLRCVYSFNVPYYRILLIKIQSVRSSCTEQRYIPGRPLRVIELWDTNDYLHFLSSVNKDDEQFLYNV
jgi:hypothetical protein